MRQNPYPPQTGNYAVKVKSEQSTHSWQDFDMVRLQISVGQDYHENDKFLATINWCKPRFDQIQICVNDTLQRFNIMFEEGVNETEAMQIAKSLGQDWINRYINFFSDIPHLEIKRWESWKSSPLYQPYCRKIYDLYDNNPEFRKSVDDNIESIWIRRQKLSPELYPKERKNRFYALSKIYLLEEISIFSLMFQTDEAIDVYPGTTIYAATVFQGREVEGAPEGLGKGHFCRIDFSRNQNVSNLYRFPKNTLG